MPSMAFPDTWQGRAIPEWIEIGTQSCLPFPSLMTMMMFIGTETLVTQLGELGRLVNERSRFQNACKPDKIHIDCIDR
jgi:hypothetical protein